MNKTLFVASLLALSGIASVAAAADDNWFVRGDMGSSSLTFSGYGSNSDIGGGLSGGYYFTPNFAVEGSYNNYGTHADGQGDSVKLDGWALGVLGKKDFGPENTGFFIEGRVGASLNRANVNLAQISHAPFSPGGEAGIESTSQNTIKPYVGVGLGYDFNSNFGVSMNYDYTQFTALGLFGHFSAHVGTVSGALEARF